MIRDLVDLAAAATARQVPIPFAGRTPVFGTRSNVMKTAEQLRAYEHFTYACIRTRATRIAELDFRLFKVTPDETDMNGAGRTRQAIRAELRRRRNYAQQLRRSVLGLDTRVLDNYERGVLDLTEIVIHPFFNLIARPNSQHERNGLVLKEKTEIHLGLTGNAYWLKVRDGNGMVRELWMLRPDRIGAVLREGELVGWAYWRDELEPIQLDVEDVIHFKMPSPVEDIFGWSPIKAGAHAHDVQSFMSIYHRNFFKNSARPDYVLVTDNPISEDQAKLILQRWKAEFSGPDRSHLPGVLGMGLKPHALQLTNTDIQFLGIAGWTLDQLITILGVPKAKLGLVADSNRANSDAADVTFNRETIRPEMRRIVETIQVQLLDEFPIADGFLDLGFPDPVPEDRDFELERRTKEWNSGFRTLNEARDAADLDPLAAEIGDRLKIQLQDVLVPIDGSSSSSSAVSSPSSIAPIPGEAKGLLAAGTAFHADPFGDEDRRSVWWQRFVQRQVRDEARLIEILSAEFRRQERDVLSAIDEVFDEERQGLHSPNIEEVIRKALGDEVDERTLEALVAQLQAFAVEEAAIVLTTIGLTADVGPNHAAIQDFLRTKPIRVRNINDVTREAIREELVAWSSANESLFELRGRIRNRFDVMRSRIGNIARTESIGALNVGAQAAYETGQVPYKQWLSSQDERVRETHVIANGQIQRTDDPFRVGAALLMYPGDPNSNHAEEVCRCRCTTVPRHSGPDIENL